MEHTLEHVFFGIFIHFFIYPIKFVHFYVPYKNELIVNIGEIVSCTVPGIY